MRFALLGTASGSLVALVSLGVVVTFRASGVLVFSTGAVAAFGTFVCYSLRDEHGVPWQVALAGGLLCGAALGAVTHLLVVQALERASNLTRLIASLSLMALVQGLIEVLWPAGSEAGRGHPRSILPTGAVHLAGDLVISSDRLILIGAAVVVAAVLWAVFARTSFGLATSAVAEDRVLAALGGWSPRLIERVCFVLAATLATGAVIFMAPIVGLDATGLTLLIVPALAAALIGSFSSFPLTVLAAVTIGIAEAELARFRLELADLLGVDQASISGLPDALPLLAIIAVTAWTGRLRPSRGDVVRRQPLPGSGRVRPIVIALGSGSAAAAVLVASDTWADAIGLTLIAAIVVLSVVVITGMAGQLSLAQWGLAGFGAWVAARAAASAGLPFEAAMVAGVACTVPAGLLVALPALRARGVDLAIATLGFALLLEAVIFNNGSLTGGFVGTVVPSPRVLGIDLDPVAHPQRYGLCILVAFVGCGLAVANLRRGRAGRRLLAVRSNERAAAALGVGVYGAKLYAFGLASAVAAVAGVLHAFRRPNVLFQDFHVLGSITAVQHAVIGGIGWVGGAVIGGLLSPGSVADRLLDERFDLRSEYLVIAAAGFVLLQLPLLPDGAAAPVARLLRSPVGRRRPAGVSSAGEPLFRPPGRRRAPLRLEVLDLTVRFGGVAALQDVSLTVDPGEVVGLIGPNGAGKTTLLDAVAGFTLADSGAIRLGDTALDRWSPERRARAGIGRSWQAVELFGELTVRENLLIAADDQARRRYLTDLLRPGIQPITDELGSLIDELGLEPWLDQRPDALPHGAQRLAGIARAMGTSPAVVLLDEPAAGLDLPERAELAEAIRHVARLRGVGVLLVEHDVSLVMSTCDRVAVLDFGVLIAEGPPAQVASDPRVVEAYLGVDQPAPLDVTDARGRAGPQEP